MRVLFLNDLFDPRLGSSVRQMYQQATRLRELGHETLLVASTSDRGEVGRTELEGCQVHRLYSDYPFRFRAWVSTARRPLVGELASLLEEWRPDVVHSHIVHTHLSYGALTAARRSGAGVVFTAHDAMTFCYHKLLCSHGGEANDWQLTDYEARAGKCVPCQRLRFRPGRNRHIRRVLARDVHRLTVVSDELGTAIRRNGIRVDRTIHNAIPLRDRLPSAEDAGALRARFGVTDNPLIAIGGRLNEQKGIRQLFQAMAVLRREFPELRMLVMGKEDLYRQGFEDMAREAGVADLVVCTGWLAGDDLAHAYAALDVMVTPSICFETFGMLNLEAMEFAKPVVATSFGGCKEVIRDGENGFTVNPFHVEDLAERIAMLLRDDDLRRRMGARGRQLAEESFSIERLTDEFLEEYDRARALAGEGAALAPA